MIATLPLLIAAAMTPAATRFAAEHPKSARIAAADGNLVHASGFLVDTGLRDPAKAARAFLATSGDAFGLAGQTLLLEGAPAAGEPGAVRFSRAIQGLPVFGSAVVVGVDSRARPLVVNTGPVPSIISGSHRIGSELASSAAIASLGGNVQGVGPAAVLGGWRSFPGTTRAVYRVDFIAQQPAGDWRVYVDGETGKVLFRQDLRYRATAPGTVYDVSPVERASALCPFTGSGGRQFCNTPSNQTFPNLTTGANLTGTQTTVFNCNGQDAPTSAPNVPGLCSAVSAVGGAFNFASDTTFQSATDNFSAGMAYFHLDKHVSFFKALDPTLPPPGSRAVRGSMPALVNAHEGGAVLENAFFSGGLDAMVFGQGARADYAYDATVMYHEFTHGVVFAWGDFNIDIDSHGGLDEPGAVNEGTADAMAVSETGRSSIGGFIGSASSPATAALRDMNDPTALRTCQGNGTPVTQLGASAINGLDGEVHDDGEIWNGFYWEVFDGLRTAGVKGCNGACEAAPAIQYKAMQLAGGTSPGFNSYWQTFKAAATALFPSQPSVATYVDCVAKRRKLDKCDRTVPVFAGETKVQFVRLRYSTFQVVMQATTNNTQFAICSAQGVRTTLYQRANNPIELNTIDPNTGDATITADVAFTLTQPCSSGSAIIHINAAGTYYFLLDAPDALIGGNPGFELYKWDVSAFGMAARPGNISPPICSPPGPLAITADNSSLPPRGQKLLTASGGSLSGYTWSMATNASGATINASNGLYTAGATGSVSDVVKVTDSAGDSTTHTFNVTAGVSVAPATATLAPRAHQTFSAGGGSGVGFNWALTTNASGGSIDGSGSYAVGGTGGVTDVVTATDSLGNTATATVTVSAAPKSGGCATGGAADAAGLLLAALGLWRMRRRPAG